jgi:ATP-binding cassette, subfamily B, bacterial PglK
MVTSSLRNLLPRLWRHFKHRRKIQFILIFVFTLFTSVAEIMSIGAIIPFLGVLTSPGELFSQPFFKPFLSALNITQVEELLWPVTVIFCVSAIVSAIMRFSLMVMQTRFGHALGSDLGLSIYRGTLYQPYTVHLSRNSSEVIAGVSRKVEMLVYDTIGPFLLLMSSSVFLVAIFFVIVMVNPIVAITSALGLGVVYGLIVALSKSALLKSSDTLNRTLNTMFKVLQEGLGGIRDVLIDGSQEIYANSYRTADRRLRRAQGNVTIIGVAPRFGVEAIALVSIALAAYYLSDNSEELMSAIPLLGALALAAQRCLPAAQQLYSALARIRGSQAQLVESLAFLDQPLPDSLFEKAPAPLSFKKNIILKEISFKYSNDAPWVLKHGFNLEIKKGSRIGFIGETGSGKSTLIDIVMGLSYPSKGSLEVDGIVVGEKNVRQWMHHIAHVPQAIFLSDTSIAENIAFGVPKEKIDFIRMQQAAKNAQLSGTIELLSEKYDTVVGERGIRLSGGQRQRIGIARALYKKADVIVFDEATSALDDDTEMAVMDAIDALSEDLTIIMVAHRLSTLKKCTEIVELKDGQISRSGTYEEVVVKGKH